LGIRKKLRKEPAGEFEEETSIVVFKPLRKKKLQSMRKICRDEEEKCQPRGAQREVSESLFKKKT